MAETKRKKTRNEKIFYWISILVIVSLVVGSVAVAASYLF